MKAAVFLGMLVAASLVALSARYPALYHAAVGAWLGGATWVLHGVGRTLRAVRRVRRKRGE